MKGPKGPWNVFFFRLSLKVVEYNLTKDFVVFLDTFSFNCE